MRLNKGEASNALARAILMPVLGRIKDRAEKATVTRANQLTLITTAIALWNNVYNEIAINLLPRKGVHLNQQLLSHLSPLGWQHTHLTGDYI